MPSVRMKADFSFIRRAAKQFGSMTIARESKVLEKGMGAATRLVANRAASKVRDDTGSLRASMSNSVVRYQGGLFLLGLMGPRRGYFAEGKRGKTVQVRRQRGESKAEYDKRNSGKKRPEWYAHLVEFGHRSVHGGGALPNFGERVKGVWNSVNDGKSIRQGTVKATSYVPPRPFLRPAFEESLSNTEQVLRDVTVEAMQKTLNKLR